MKILLIVYDNEAYAYLFPIGTAYIASSLENARFKVAIYSQDVNHYSETHLLAHLFGTSYPGSQRYYHAIKQGILEGPTDFYDKHVNSEYLTANFTSLGDDEFHECLLEGSTALLTRYFDTQKMYPRYDGGPVPEQERLVPRLPLHLTRGGSAPGHAHYPNGLADC